MFRKTARVFVVIVLCALLMTGMAAQLFFGKIWQHSDGHGTWTLDEGGFWYEYANSHGYAPSPPPIFFDWPHWRVFGRVIDIQIPWWCFQLAWGFIVIVVWRFTRRRIALGRGFPVELAAEKSQRNNG
jgi:hypothetical protein